MKKSFLILLLGLITLFGCAHKKPMKSIEVNESAKPSLSLERDEVLKRLLPISYNPQQLTKIKNYEKEFNLMLPSDRPEGNQKKEWHSSHVIVFYSNPQKIDQVALKSTTCNTSNNLEQKKELQGRLIEQVKQVSLAVFGIPFDLNEKYFKALGTNWKKNVQIPVLEKYSGASSMRISRGIYKCDGYGGYGFRFDFLLK